MMSSGLYLKGSVSRFLFLLCMQKKCNVAYILYPVLPATGYKTSKFQDILLVCLWRWLKRNIV